MSNSKINVYVIIEYLPNFDPIAYPSPSTNRIALILDLDTLHVLDILRATPVNKQIGCCMSHVQGLCIVIKH